MEKELAVMLISPRSLENLGRCLWTAELIGATPFYIFDEKGLLSLNRRRELRRASSGAIDNEGVLSTHDPIRLIKIRSDYRTIAAVVDHPEAKNLYGFEFGRKDMLLLGNEDSGIDERVLRHCDEFVTIPQLSPGRKRRSGRSPCYSLAAAGDLFFGEFMRQKYNQRN